jgi:MYXO-CTERM domain-containing protein
VAAGLALGSSLVLFSETDASSGQWPVLSARAAALVAVGVAMALLWRRRQVRLPHGRPLVLALVAGTFDVAATALLVYAVRRELLSVVAPIASLAPAFTVVLAWFITRERVPAVQRVGLALAVAGLALIAAG